MVNKRISWLGNEILVCSMYIILSSFEAFLLNDGNMFVEQRACIFFKVKIKSKSYTYTGQTHDLAPPPSPLPPPPVSLWGKDMPFGPKTVGSKIKYLRLSFLIDILFLMI